MIGRLLLLVAPLSLVGCASSTKEVSDAAVVHCAAPSRQQSGTFQCNYARSRVQAIALVTRCAWLPSPRFR